MRGRDPNEARERALEAPHTYVGLDEFRHMVQRVVDELAPGSRIRISETAREIVVALSGRHVLSLPLRETVLRPGTSMGALRIMVTAHLRMHLRRAACAERPPSGWTEPGLVLISRVRAAVG